MRPLPLQHCQPSPAVCAARAAIPSLWRTGRRRAGQQLGHICDWGGRHRRRLRHQRRLQVRRLHRHGGPGLRARPHRPSPRLPPRLGPPLRRRGGARASAAHPGVGGDSTPRLGGLAGAALPSRPPPTSRFRSGHPQAATAAASRRPVPPPPPSFSHCCRGFSPFRCRCLHCPRSWTLRC